MKKIRFVVNPCSGHNRRRPWLAQAIRDFAARHSLEAQVVVTEGPHHATELAQTAAREGFTLVAAVGGDGTMNEVAQGLIGTPTALAIVPCGSGNGLALHLGLPRALDTALSLIRTGGRLVPIDTGTLNELPFCNAMGLGFDAEISRRFNRLTRRGLPAYLRTGWTALRELRPEKVAITANGRRYEVEALVVTVANSDQYGNNARIAPGARVNDGQLDLVVVKPMGLFRLACAVPRLFLGSIDRVPAIMRVQASEFVIERAAPGVVHTDGETHDAPARLVVRAQPGSLRVLVPMASRLAVAVMDSIPVSTLASNPP